MCVYDLLETFYRDNIVTDYVYILDLTLSLTCGGGVNFKIMNIASKAVTEIFHFDERK